jgi:hypothetical protein
VSKEGVKPITVLDSGEAASLAYATIHQTLLLSDETQRAFMREVRSHIGENRLIRTARLLARAIESHILSLSHLEKRLKILQETARNPREKDDVEHYGRVLNRVREPMQGGKSE